jgi:hypothetical protein
MTRPYEKERDVDWRCRKQNKNSAMLKLERDNKVEEWGVKGRTRRSMGVYVCIYTH